LAVRQEDGGKGAPKYIDGRSRDRVHRRPEGIPREPLRELLPGTQEGLQPFVSATLAVELLP
jgi:hypothetical protein